MQTSNLVENTNNLKKCGFILIVCLSQKTSSVIWNVGRFATTGFNSIN